ncbi:MAG: hydroxymethylbilane synthase, partial [Burkholderiaceae bacterium]
MTIKEKLIIGSRGSRLSLAQAEHFKDELLLANPSLKTTQIEIKIIKTSGDLFKTENLATMGGKGLFVKEIEQELLNKNIDFAVHSLKDVPTFGHESLILAAFLKRKDERDAF